MTTTTQPASSAPANVVPIRPFSELSTDDIPYTGGKGANLGRLTQAGLPVPPGFVIGAPPYVAFRQQTGLDKRLADLLDSVDVDDTASLQKAADDGDRVGYRSVSQPDQEGGQGRSNLPGVERGARGG